MFFSLIFIGIVDLQCCVCFCCKARWISYAYIYIYVCMCIYIYTHIKSRYIYIYKRVDIYIHSFFIFFSPIVIREYWEEFSVLYSMSLSILYTVVYICQFQSPNLSLSPHFHLDNPKFAFYICDSVSIL